MNYKATYLCNLIDANLYPRKRAKEGGLDAAVKRFQTDGSFKQWTFGARIRGMKQSKNPLVKFIREHYRLEGLNCDRIMEIHQNGAPEYPKYIGDIIEIATEMAPVKTGTCFDYVSRLEDVSWVLSDTISARSPDIYPEPEDMRAHLEPFVGWKVLRWREWLPKQLAKMAWKFVSIRNAHVHEGRELTEREIKFIANVPKRCAESLASLARSEGRFKKETRRFYEENIAEFASYYEMNNVKKIQDADWRKRERYIKKAIKNAEELMD